MAKVLVVGAGLGGLTTALRLRAKGFEVHVVEMYHQAGGRLNELKKDGFTFDLAPTFFSMSYEFKEFAEYCNINLPFSMVELDPLYTVNFAGSGRNFRIYKDLKKLAKEFEGLENDFENKMAHFLAGAQRLFTDVEYKVIKKNHESIVGYLKTLATIPVQHMPLLLRSMWDEMNRNFDSYEVKVIFSLVAFFLGATPFDTPAVYKILSYTELKHDGYYNIQGGMYRIVEGLLGEFERLQIPISYNTEIVRVEHDGDKIAAVYDASGKKWEADLFVINADAAFFRGRILNRPQYTEERLDKMSWTLAPFTLYLGVKGTIPNLDHHNYFLGDNFKEYSTKIFKNKIRLDKPYYYVQASSKTNPTTAPDGHENLFILCPVPDLRFKPDWSDSEWLANTIIKDLSERVDYDIASNLISRTVINPLGWAKMFNLYQGSGLGLAHNLTQVGGFRPRNVDEEFENLFYVGASTVPGTGLPMVIISSRLVAEQILKRYESVQ